MGAQRNIGELLAGGCVQHTECSLAVADVNLVWGGVVPNIVGIALKMRGLQQLEGTVIKDPACPIISVGDKKLVFSGNKEDSLRFPQPYDAREQFTGAEIEHFEGIVAQSRNEQ